MGASLEFKDNERAARIVIAVLNGGTYEAIAKAEGVQRERCRQIVKKTVGHLDEDLFRRYQQTRQGHKTDLLRAHADVLVPKIQRWLDKRR